MEFSIGRSGMRSGLQRSRFFRRFGAVGTTVILVASSSLLFTGIVLAAGTSNNGDVTCGYPSATGGPASTTTFVESTVLRNVGVVGTGSSAKIVAYANDEKGLLLGVTLNGSGTPTPWTNSGTTTGATLSAPLSTAANITSLPVNPSTGTVNVGDHLLVSVTGHNITFTASALRGPGSTNFAVVSKKPNFAYPTGTVVTDTTAASSAFGHAINPDLGNLTATDASITGGTASRPQYPAIYITNITQHPLVNGHGIGDWQNVNGQPPAGNRHVNDIFGTWLTAHITGGSYLLDSPLPPSNGWNLGPFGGGTNADNPSTVTFATGPTTFAAFGDEGYGAEVRWNANTLVDEDGEALTAGNVYRIQVIDHDGDQNKAGGDTGEYCTRLTFPGPPVIGTVPNAAANPGNAAIVNVKVGTSINDRANLTGSAAFGPVTGTVDFHLYFIPAGQAVPNPLPANYPCDVGHEVTTGGFPDLGEALTPAAPPAASVANSASFANTALGTYYFEDVYSGDANYTAATEACGIQIVTTVDARILLTPASATNIVGNAHTLTATLQTTSGPTFAFSTTNVHNPSTITFSIQSGTATFTSGPPFTCTTVSGSCTIDINDTAIGTSTIRATSTFGDDTLTDTTATFTKTTNSTGNDNDATKIYIKPKTSLAVTDRLIGVPATSNLVTTTGSVTYKYFTNSLCTAGETTINTVTVDGSGNIAASNSVTVNPGDSLWFQATFNGTVGGNSETFTTDCNEAASSGL